MGEAWALSNGEWGEESDQRSLLGKEMSVGNLQGL